MPRQAKTAIVAQNSASASVEPQSNAVARYVSIFENPAEFGARVQIAQALSKTCFIPESFRGKPEDCLVALDMAARLELNPIAVFSDIYVIDNRAAFSSKFLIALVNRSGRFSRIQYEEGIDGEAEVTFSGWGEQRGQRKTWKEKVPNYFAQASFTEIASGEVFTSPRVDMNFAEKNGWVAKSGSKWQSMPEIMCRYRAASILIKSVCPEIVMGLEWQEDLLDARDEAKPAPPRRVELARHDAPAAAAPALNAPERETVVELVDDDTFQRFGAQINVAFDVGALNRVASAIADANLTDAQKEALRRVWINRKKELTPAPQTLPPAEGLPAETVLNVATLQAKIKAAQDAETLETIRAGLDEAIDAGQILPGDKDRLLRALDARAAELEEEGPPLPTPQQIEEERARRAEIQRFAEEGKLEELNFMRAAVFDLQYNGAITPQQAQQLTEEIETAVEGLQ